MGSLDTEDRVNPNGATKLETGVDSSHGCVIGTWLKEDLLVSTQCGKSLSKHRQLTQREDPVPVPGRVT